MRLTETIQAAIDGRKTLVLTLDPPDLSPPMVVRMRPLWYSPAGLIAGYLEDGTWYSVYDEFISDARVEA